MSATSVFQMNEMFGVAIALSCITFDARRVVAAVDHGDGGGQLRQVDGFFDRRVAAADDRHGAALEEEAVAGGAGGDASARQLAVHAELEPLRRRARGDDQRLGG